MKITFIYGIHVYPLILALIIKDNSSILHDRKMALFRKSLNIEFTSIMEFRNSKVMSNFLKPSFGKSMPPYKSAYLKNIILIS